MSLSSEWTNKSDDRVRVLVGLWGGSIPGHAFEIGLGSRVSGLKPCLRPRYDQQGLPDDRTRPDRQKIVQRWNSQV